ncbi:DNA polymerase, beta domain protein region [Thermoproteus uzoniensis 768-20]|uniref:DNA polymerase, beta domain protein region n=1 Tax=Thermoproteus uzoniensis (strain 768-20) TaxID=999630 RepID=F2L5I1_THEU7|nr:DNA polymerase, beta domain protein region [Thermoproteus uzoniensis 768-20]
MEGLVERYKSLGAKLVVLFGSRARGDYTESSDYDVLVVADDLPADPREAYGVLFDLEHPAVQPLGVRSDRFLEMLRRGNVLLLEALEDGVVLYADRSFLEETLAVYREARRCFRREGRVWVRIC